MTTEENRFNIRFDQPVTTEVSEDALSYESTFEAPITVEPDEPYVTYQTQSFTFTDEEAAEEADKTADMLASGDGYFVENSERWQGYVDTIDNADVDQAYKNAAVKAIETLMTNWISAAGALQHGGIVPSKSYQWFIGLWGWDSWKQATGMARFNPEAAEDNIRAHFDYQITPDDPVRPQDAGTIVDASSTTLDRSAAATAATGTNATPNQHWRHGRSTTSTARRATWPSSRKCIRSWSPTTIGGTPTATSTTTALRNTAPWCTIPTISMTARATSCWTRTTNRSLTRTPSSRQLHGKAAWTTPPALTKRATAGRHRRACLPGAQCR